MKWDAVEREFFVISAQLNRLSISFGALATELRRERMVGRVTPMRSHAAIEKSKDQTGAREPGAALFD